jgi:hypothetical protein
MDYLDWVLILNCIGPGLFIIFLIYALCGGPLPDISFSPSDNDWPPII